MSDYTIEPDPRNRLHYLLNKDYLSNDEIGEAYSITKEIGMKDDEIPLRLQDQQIIKELSIELQKLRDERKVLQLQNDIFNERDKIRELKENKGDYEWCPDCQDWVRKED